MWLASPPGFARQLTHTLDPDVVLDWELSVDSSQPALDVCIALTESQERLFALQQGTFQLAGQPPSSFALTAYDANLGTELWTTLEFGQTPGFVPSVITASSDGAHLFVAGTYGVHTGVVRLDAGSGALGWIALDFAPGGHFAVVEDIETTPSGSRVAVSLTYVSGPKNLVRTLLLDGVGGALLWAQTVDDSALQQEKAHQLIVDEVRGRVLTVYSGQGAASQKQTVVIGWDLASGAQVWTEPYPPTGSASPRDLDFDPIQGQAFLALTGDLNSVRVQDISTGAVIWNLVTTLQATHVAVQPGGAQVAVLGDGVGLNRVEAYDVALGTSAWVGTLDVGNPFQKLRTQGLVYSLDGSRLLAGFEADYQSFPGAPKQELMAAGFETVSGSMVWVAAEDKSTTTGGDVAKLVGVETAMGARLALSTELDTGTSQDIRFVMLDAGNGALAWETIEGSQTTQAIDSFVDVALSPDETVAFAIGAEADPLTSASNLQARALDAATGLELWSVPLPGLVANDAEVQIDPQGNVVYVSSGGTQFGAAALDASTGAVLWSRTWDWPTAFGDHVQDFAVSATADRLYVSGFSDFFDFGTLTSAYRAVVFALDAASGAELWRDEYTANPSTDTTASALALSSDGTRLFQTGEADQQLFVRAYDTMTGAALWTTLFDLSAFLGANPGYNSGLTLSADPTGSLVLASGRCSASAFGSGYELVTVAMDASTGALQWFTPAAQAEFVGMTLNTLVGTLSADGSRLYLSGTAGIGSPSTLRFVTRALDTSTGAVVWQSISSEADALSVEDLVLSPDSSRIYASNNVLLEVTSQGWTDGTRVTCYDAATGAEYWSTEHVGDSFYSDEAGRLAVANDFVIAASRNHLLTTTDDGFLTRYHDQALISGPAELSLVAGGQQELELAASSSSQGDFYLVLGSMTGTAPGTPVQGLVLPLNVDAYFMLMLTAPSSVLHGGTFGVLDAAGRGHATVTLPAGLSTTLAGLTLHHAFVVFDVQGTVPFLSNASALTLVP